MVRATLVAVMKTEFFRSVSVYIGLLCMIGGFGSCYALTQQTLQRSHYLLSKWSVRTSTAQCFGPGMCRRRANFERDWQPLFDTTTSIPLEAATFTEEPFPVSPKLLVARGMEAFRQTDINGSIGFFDAAEQQSDGRLTPYLWQRGISYYYADKFLEGSRQFRKDVSVNPLDVEEIVWDIACLNRLSNICGETPSTKMMSLPKGKKDRRKIMSTVYSLFCEEATEQDLAQAGHEGNIADEFYSLFYLGLYCESKCESSKAESPMKAAASSNYATGVGKADYMTAVANTHCKVRHWK